MARQRKGILDGFSGSVRNLTGQKKDGQNIIRSKPSKPNPSKSTEQAKTRSDFSKAVDLFHLFRVPEFDKLWAAKDDSKTQLNNFISANYGYNFSVGIAQRSKLFGRYISDRQNFTIAGYGPAGNRNITFFFNKSGGGPMPDNSDIFVGFVAFPNLKRIHYHQFSFIRTWGSGSGYAYFVNFPANELSVVGAVILKPDYSDFYATEQYVFITP